MPDEVRLRAAEAGDVEFLRRLYADVRGPEVSAWGWAPAQRDAFLGMQFEAQRRSYDAAYRDARHEILCVGEVPIGRRIISESGEGLLLVDIALLTEWRNRGIGTRLLREALEECRTKRCPLRLKVLVGNPAERLYTRLGFVAVDPGQMYTEMEWKPEGA